MELHESETCPQCGRQIYEDNPRRHACCEGGYGDLHWEGDSLYCGGDDTGYSTPENKGCDGWDAVRPGGVIGRRLARSEALAACEDHYRGRDDVVQSLRGGA